MTDGQSEACRLFIVPQEVVPQTEYFDAIESEYAADLANSKRMREYDCMMRWKSARQQWEIDEEAQRGKQ